MRHQIPRHSQLPKRRCPTGSILFVCFEDILWPVFFDSNVDEDSEQFFLQHVRMTPSQSESLRSHESCSFQVAQFTYYWNLQKHQKQGHGLAISSIIAKVYILGTISESCGNSQASKVSFVHPEVEEVLNRSSTLLFMKGSPEMPRCRFSRLATWRQRRISTMECCNIFQWVGVSYPGFIGEYGEPRRGKEFQYKFRTMWPWVILPMSAIVWPHRFRDSKWFDLAKLLRRLRSYSNTRLNLILSTCLNILPWDLSVQLRPTQKLDPETCKLALTQAISFVWLCSPSHSKSAICHAPFYICPWLSFLDHSLVAPDLFVPSFGGVFCRAAPCKVWI